MKRFKAVYVALVIVFLHACSSTPTIVDIQTFSPIETMQFQGFEDTLPSTVMVTLSDTSEVEMPIDWSRGLSAIDVDVYGDYIIEGYVDVNALNNSETMRIEQSIIIHPVVLTQALESMDEYHLFKQFYQAFDHADKAEIQSFFVPNDKAVQELLSFLEMPPETFIQQEFFTSFMMDHLSKTSISGNRLETNIPSVYQTLSDYELIVEGEIGAPLINMRVQFINSHRIHDGYIHLIDGIILSEQSLRSIGFDFLDASLSTRFMTLLNDTGILWDIIFGRQFTIFVPSERALFDYAERHDLTLNELMNDEELEALLLNHIIRNPYSTEMLFLDAPLDLLSLNDTLHSLWVEDGILYIGNARIINTEYFSGIGYLHMIDAVIE